MPAWAAAILILLLVAGQRLDEFRLSGSTAAAWGLGPRLRFVLDITAGKPGQNRKMMRNRCLVVAGEFVWLKTGTYNDEHLAYLMQAVSLVPAPEADFSGTDFSGDAIRKKRNYLSSKYPFPYSRALSEAQRLPRCQRNIGKCGLPKRRLLPLR